MNIIVPKPPVVLLEPDYFWREIFGSHLDSLGVKVFKFSKGLDAARFIHAHRPRVLITELVLPDVSGELVISDFRSSPFLPQLKIFVVTSSEARERMEKIFNLGISSYFVKTRDSLPDIMGILREQLA